MEWEALQCGSCPHCQIYVRFEVVEVSRHSKWSKDPTQVSSYNHAAGAGIRLTSHETHLDIRFCTCPQCDSILVGAVEFCRSTEEIASSEIPDGSYKFYPLWPRGSERPVPPEVPDHVARDYKEASLTLEFSPKASGALSRRCLETVLTEKGGATQRLLSEKIEHVLASLPSAIAHNLDYLREIGNFGVHQQKDTHTGELVEVEEGEAEWSLDVLDSLFDHYYVQPERNKKRRAEFDKKIDQAGRKPINQ